jgi:hypothetical protein
MVAGDAVRPGVAPDNLLATQPSIRPGGDWRRVCGQISTVSCCPLATLVSSHAACRSALSSSAAPRYQRGAASLGLGLHICRQIARRTAADVGGE